MPDDHVPARRRLKRLQRLLGCCWVFLREIKFDSELWAVGRELFWSQSRLDEVD